MNRSDLADLIAALTRVADALEFFVQRAKLEDAKATENDKWQMQLSNQR